MTAVRESLASVGRLGIVLVRAVRYFPATLCRSDARHDLLRQLYATGVRTLPVLTVVSLFMGMILALQVGLELRRFNQEIYLGAAVMLTLIREMAPFSCGSCLSRTDSTRSSSTLRLFGSTAQRLSQRQSSFR